MLKTSSMPHKLTYILTKMRKKSNKIAINVSTILIKKMGKFRLIFCGLVYNAIRLREPFVGIIFNGYARLIRLRQKN